MKSTAEQLEKRGFLAEGSEVESNDFSFAEKIALLESKIPMERTLGARLLKSVADKEAIVELLIRALTIEKKLYPKIELSKTLVSCGKQAVKPLIRILGKVGRNQHIKMPEKEFKKDNYPLPRDISSRILANIGQLALTELLNQFDQFDDRQLSEAIDAIGFICFYDDCPNTYESLKKCYQQKTKNDLIKWKIIRACSSFPESEVFLEIEKKKLQNKRLQKEIKRSIYLIGKRK